MQRHQWTDDEIIASASKYRHRGDWKRSADRLDSAAYQAALARPEAFKRATAHMVPKSHPYSGSYVIYAYEFADKHAYVGATFQPATRRTFHALRGPVFDHALICPQYTYKVVENGINSPFEVIDAEGKWQAWYKDQGWIPLWKAKAGGLGAVMLRKWTEEAVMAEASKYKTRQEWLDNSQASYRVAKANGWFDRASAHMPARVLGIGAGREVSDETREKMRQAKLGTKHTPEQRAARAEAAKALWAERRKTILARLPAPPETTEQTLSQIGIHPKKRGPYQTSLSALTPEERHARRLDVYKRSYNNRSEATLAQLKAERDAVKLRCWHAIHQ